MKHIFKRVIPFYLFFILVCSSIIFLGFGVNASDNDVTIENFDSYGAGVNSGTNAYVTWWAGDGRTSAIDYVSSPLSLNQDVNNIANWKYTYINLTNDISMNGFSYNLNVTWSADVYYEVDLINSSGDVFVGFRTALLGWYVKIDDGWTLWKSQVGGNVIYQWWNFGFQGNHTEDSPINYVYYYLHQTGNDTLYFQKEERYNSLNDFSDQDLSQIRIKTWTDQAGQVIDGKIFFDDFVVSNDEWDSGGIGSTEGYNLRCMNPTPGTSGTTSSMFELIGGPNDVDWLCIIGNGPWYYHYCVESTEIGRASCRERV